MKRVEHFAHRQNTCISISNPMRNMDNHKDTVEESTQVWERGGENELEFFTVMELQSDKVVNTENGLQH